MRPPNLALEVGTSCPARDQEGQEVGTVWPPVQLPPQLERKLFVQDSDARAIVRTGRPLTEPPNC
jgi:hypothetical protein